MTDKLIERIKSASGADRQLDYAILEAINPCPTRYTEAHPYTASIDAALTLVPDGWFVYGMGERVAPIIFKGDKHTSIGFWADVQHRDGGLLQQAEGATLPLALCAAALRAWETQQ